VCVLYCICCGHCRRTSFPPGFCSDFSYRRCLPVYFYLNFYRLSNATTPRRLRPIWVHLLHSRDMDPSLGSNWNRRICLVYSFRCDRQRSHPSWVTWNEPSMSDWSLRLSWHLALSLGLCAFLLRPIHFLDQTPIYRKSTGSFCRTRGHSLWGQLPPRVKSLQILWIFLLLYWVLNYCCLQLHIRHYDKRRLLVPAPWFWICESMKNTALNSVQSAVDVVGYYFIIESGSGMKNELLI